MVIKNFLFHRVSEEVDKLWPPMRPALFEEIIRFLSTNYEVVSLERVLADRNSYASSPKQKATILFDDGYKDNIEYAAPILKKYNCSSSFYVVTNCIDKNVPTWTYLLDNALQYTRISRLELDAEYVPEKLKTISLAGSGMTHGPVSEIKPWIKGLSNKKRLEILQMIFEQCKDVPVPENKMMSWQDIRQLKQAGHIIGSHSHTHPMLAALEDESEIDDELCLSAARIKTEVGEAPITISYPIGSFDERIIHRAVVSGYKYGLAVQQKFYRTDKDGLYAIPRVELYQESWWKVRLRINGVYNKLKQLKS